MIGGAKPASRSRSPGSGPGARTECVTNDELAEYVDTSNEWILERTGIRERRMAAKEEALSDVALPACATRSRRPASTARTSTC